MAPLKVFLTCLFITLIIACCKFLVGILGVFFGSLTITICYHLWFPKCVFAIN